MAFVFINDRFVPEEEAVIGVKDLAIRRGFGIFDFFRTVNFTPLFLNNHLSRFFYSAEKIGLEIPLDKKRIQEICLQLIEKNQIPDGGVRLILTGGYSANGYLPANPNLIITNEPLKLVDDATRSTGVGVISHDYQREFPEVKTINYFTGIMLQQKAISTGAFDVLYHDRGQVREFTRSNIFIVTGKNKIITPAEKLLKGVTRSNIITLARNKYDVEERSLTMNELFTAREVFMTGTTKRVLPVVKIDNQLIADGKPGLVTKGLYDDFYAFEKQQLEK